MSSSHNQTSHDDDDDDDAVVVAILALIDLSGTLHVGDEPIDDAAVRAVNNLLEFSRRDNNNNSLDVLFLTNTTTVSQSTLHSKLYNMGYTSIRLDDDIMTSAHAVKQYIQTHQLRPYCLVSSDLLEHDLGIVMNEDKNNNNDDDDDFYDSVLIGLSPDHFTYERLNRAFRILHNHQPTTATTAAPNCHRLLAFHRSNYTRDSLDDNELSLGPGGFVTLLERTTDHQALVLGKPSVDFYQAAIRRKKKDNNYSKIIMVGDDYQNDILGAWKCPWITETILVQTGKYRSGDEDKLLVEQQMLPRNAIQQHHTMPSIVEAVEYILEQCQ